jgi:hypothetical protein
MIFSERLDLDIDARRKIQLHQCVNRLLGGFEDIEQTLVRTDLKLLPRFLIDVRRTKYRRPARRSRERNGTGHLRAGPLRGIDNLGRRLVQYPVVVRLQPDSNSFSQCHCQSRISDTVPAPTVRPPSRIANRRPLSIATGVCNSTFNCTLSPGITISVPSGSIATPVTSVVRK